MEYRPKTVTLDEDTRRLLSIMSRYTGEGDSQIVRWALAYYAASGPWHAGPEVDRDVDLRHPPNLPIGPTYARRIQS